MSSDQHVEGDSTSHQGAAAERNRDGLLLAQEGDVAVSFIEKEMRILMDMISSRTFSSTKKSNPSIGNPIPLSNMPPPVIFLRKGRKQKIIVDQMK